MNLTDKNKKIVVTTDGKVTTARLYQGSSLINTATSSCHDDDSFDMIKGALLAISRLDKHEKNNAVWRDFIAGKVVFRVPATRIKAFLRECTERALNYYPQWDAWIDHSYVYFVMDSRMEPETRPWDWSPNHMSWYTCSSLKDIVIDYSTLEEDI